MSCGSFDFYCLRKYLIRMNWWDGLEVMGSERWFRGYLRHTLVADSFQTLSHQVHGHSDILRIFSHPQIYFSTQFKCPTTNITRSHTQHKWSYATETILRISRPRFVWKLLEWRKAMPQSLLLRNSTSLVWLGWWIWVAYEIDGVLIIISHATLDQSLAAKVSQRDLNVSFFIFQACGSQGWIRGCLTLTPRSLPALAFLCSPSFQSPHPDEKNKARGLSGLCLRWFNLKASWFIHWTCESAQMRV